MSPPSDADLLDVWERGLSQPPGRRALVLLSISSQGEPTASMTVGQRDALLMIARRTVFGSGIAALVDCPRCAATLEMEFDIADLLGEPPAISETQPLSMHINGYEITARLPTTEDLAAVAVKQAAVIPSGRQLLKRCLLNVRQDGESIAADDLPESVIAALGQRLSEADPHVDIGFSLTCAACSNAWRESFDIGQFFWTELNAWASRLLNDVHQLARAYGWREADILAMSSRRRSLYLEMAAA